MPALAVVPTLACLWHCRELPWGRDIPEIPVQGAAGAPGIQDVEVSDVSSFSNEGVGWCKMCLCCGLVKPEGSVGSEQLRLEAVRMFLLLLFRRDTIHSLFSAVKTCTEALQNICWCY